MIKSTVLGLLLVGALISNFSIKAVAQEHDQDQGVMKAKLQTVVEKSYKDGIQNIRLLKIDPLAMTAMNALVKRGVETLKEHGHSVFADQALNSWVTLTMELSKNNGFSTMALGGHAPLSAWLAKFYVELESRLGKFICEMQHLDDIKNINYGYVVTMNPRGTITPKDSWDEDEYRVHFVPFTTAVLYWTMNTACSAAFNFVGSLICSTLAEGPRFAYKYFVAPGFSNEIYQSATRQRKQ